MHRLMPGGLILGAIVLLAPATWGAGSATAAATLSPATPTVAAASGDMGARMAEVLAGIQLRQQKGVPAPTRAASPLALQRNDQSLFSLLWRLFVSLGVVLALLSGVLWLLRRNLSTAGRHAPDRVRVVSRTALSNRSCLYIVEVVGRTLLVGESQTGGLRLISDLGHAREEVEAEPGREAMDELFTDRSFKESPLSFARELKACLRFLRMPGRRSDRPQE